jgi:hypothetical protein
MSWMRTPTDTHSCVGIAHNNVYPVTDNFVSLNRYSVTLKSNEAVYKANYIDVMAEALLNELVC